MNTPGSSTNRDTNPLGRTLGTGQATLHYLDLGRGPALVFLHGMGVDANVWRPQLNAFESSNRLIVPDLPGHGDNRVDGGLTPRRIADDVFALIDHLGLKQVVLVGLSMGANISLSMSLIYPELVAGMVLASAFAEPSVQFKSVLRTMADEAEKVIDMSEYAARRTERILLHTSPAARNDFERGAKRASKAAIVTLTRSLADWNMTPLLRYVKVPALIVAGDADPYVSVKSAAHLATQIQGSRLVVLSGAGHICNLDGAPAFNRATAAFLADLRWSQAMSSPRS